MPTVNIGGKDLPVDEEGYMQDPSLWTKEIGEAFAKKDGITLTDEHWEIINFLRDYFQEYEIAPAIRVLVKEIKQKFGPEKGNLKYVYKLFPAGPAKQACKFAGLPKPTGCV
jgi:dissimilatory sulfite reductase related protein